MKLSEAIRLGAMLKPQAFHAPFSHTALESADSLCALAGAAAALSMRTLNCYSEEWVALFGWSNTTYAPCPAGACLRNYCVGAIVAHLNDRHHWTRERIADWVAGFEAAQALDQPASVAAVREDAEVPVASPRA